MRQEKPLSLLAIVTLVCALFLAGCSQPGGSSTQVEKKTYPLVLQRDEKGEVEESEMNLYFVDGGDVPYVAASEFMPLFGSLYKDEDLDIPSIEFSLEHQDNDYCFERPDNGWMIDFNPVEDTINFTSYDGFLQSPGDNALVGLVKITEEGTGGVSRLLKAGEHSYDRQGLVTIFKMGDYDIDLVEANDECYVPLQTMHDILLAKNYYFTVFNGEKVFVYAYGSDLNDQIYTVESGEMSKSYADFNFHELLFLLDNFYGLKPEHNIDDFFSFIANAGLYEDLSGTDPQVFDAALARLASLYFDDLHSGLIQRSCLAPMPEDDMDLDEELDDEGASSSSSSSNTMSYGSARMKYEPEMDPLDEDLKVYQYKEVDDTAIVTFDQFRADKKDYYKEADLDNPQDTIELIASAHKQITREGSPIKNVVLDLSNNGGGDADAAAFVIAWLTGQNPVAIRDTLTGAQSVVSYAADVNLDGEFSYDDSLMLQVGTGEMKIYCLTSPLSFSCGNLVPAALKGTYGVTLIGQRTGGGSCMVLPCTTASGAQFQISGTRQISVLMNGSFYNSDTGIEVDVPITSTDTMYDREKLVEFIHGLQ